MAADDCLRDYTDSRFGRFLLYLLVYRNKALDWDGQASRIGFEGVELFADFRPQWHHIFPTKFLEAAGVPDEKINALANIAVIGPAINIRISAQDPMNYIGRYNITADAEIVRTTKYGWMVQPPLRPKIHISGGSVRNILRL